MAYENPFVHSRVLPPEKVINRDQEIDELSGLALGGHYSRLVAPRRFGKTSMLGKMFKKAEADHGLVCIMVDLWGVDSFVDFTIRLERAYAGQLQQGIRDRIESHLKTLDLGLSLGTKGVSFNFQQRSKDIDPFPALHALLDLPKTILEDTAGRALIVFDEF